MIREHLFDKRAPADPMFRWRGGEISRIEGFSDGVFAVTVSLLVFSSSVPTTFYDFWRMVRDLPVFVVSFALLFLAWHYHYRFFRRYGLEDLSTLLLNGLFLFLILFFAYPLKFLARFLWALVLGDSTRPMFELPAGVTSAHPWLATELGQRTGMMAFYGLGICGVFGVLALMGGYAYRLRDKLELDRLERHLTRIAIGHNLILVGVALASLSVLFLTGQPGTAGIIYFVLGPLHGALGFYGGVRADRIQKQLLAGAGAAD